MTEAALSSTPERVPLQPIVDMAEPARFASERRLVAAESSGGAITLAWDDGSSVRLHPLWLRSECACPVCRDRVTLERTFDQFRLPPELAAQVEVSAEGALRLTWPDGHVSLFDPGWLYLNARGEGPESTGRGNPRLWHAADLAGAIPTFEHQAIMREPRALHAWLTALRDVGLTLLAGVPAAEREVERIARRISLPRDSNFGAVFDVMTMANANSNAYTAIELPPHVDLPTREYQPGCQFFHCLDNQAAGGESTYVDGFAVAEHLRAEEPEIFRVLSTAPLGFRFCDAVSDYVWHAPALVLDEHGALREVRFIPWLMTPLAAEPERFAPIYAALRRFADLTRDPRFQLRIKLTAGTMSAFDNRRVLHGRAAFEPASGRRHFQGCYIEHEEIESRIRVLEREL
jgi:gamma-butyrobetaine dioxygenase